MAIKFTSTSDQNTGVRAVVYGNPGVGKTKLCGTLPDALIISSEKNLLSLKGENIPVIEVHSAQDMTDAFEFVQLSADAATFKNICLDSVSDMAEIMLAEFKEEFNDARLAYGKLSHEMERLLRKFRDELPGRNLYCTAKMGSVQEDLTGMIRYSPLMPGKSLTNSLPYFFNEVLVMRMYEDESGAYRYLQTALDVQYIAKDASGVLEPTEPPDLGLIFNKILTGDVQPTQTVLPTTPTPTQQETN